MCSNMIPAMVRINREHLLTSLHLVLHGLLALALRLHENWVLPEELSQPTGPVTLYILLVALFLELLLAHFLQRMPPAEQMTANVCVRHFCLLSTLFAWSVKRTNMQIYKQFHAAKYLRPVVTYVWLHILHAENVGGFGLMSIILYSLGIHLSIYGTTGPKVQGTWMQLSFIGGMPADALGLAAIQRLFQGERFSLQRLANRWFYAAISFTLMDIIGYQLESCIPCLMSAYMFWICLLNFVVILAAIYFTLTMIESFGVVTLLFVDDMMDGIIVVFSKDHPQSTVTTTSLLGYWIASCGFIIYQWTKAREARMHQLPARINGNRAALGRLFFGR